MKSNIIQNRNIKGMGETGLMDSGAQIFRVLKVFMQLTMTIAEID